MADFANGKIQAYVGPRELGAADNLEEVIVKFINDANHSLDIAVQEIDSVPIAQAIIDASWRGVNVRVFLEQDYLIDRKVPALVTASGETDEAARLRCQWEEPADNAKAEVHATNRHVLAALLRNCADVKADYNPKIFHQKFVIRDNRTLRGKAKSPSAILTGSANFTKTDTHSNLNHIIIFHDHRICKDYQDEFEEMRSGTFGAMRERRDPEPHTVNIEGIPVRILFAPDHAPELEIVKQMLKCSERVDFAIFTFSGSSGIDDAMIMLRAAGKMICGALDPGQGAHDWTKKDWMHNIGIELFLPKKQGTFKDFRKLHHKLMVIDRAIVVAGSMNYTEPANLYNDENIFVIGSPYPDLPKKDGGPVNVESCAAIADFFRAEIDRIIINSKRYVPGS